MLYSIKGKLIVSRPDMAVIECGGVGFRCKISFMTARRLPSVGEQAALLTVMNVREDAITLLGFAEQEELQCYELLTAVTGVGPKAAMAILSTLAPQQIWMAVASGDHKLLTQAPGVGAKLAQRIVLELKDKAGNLNLPDNGITVIPPGGVSAAAGASEAVAALTALGFTAGEASAAVGRLDSSLPVEQLIKEALRSIANTKR